MQAQLRAAVFTAIDEEERKQGIHGANTRFQELADDPAGALLAQRNAGSAVALVPNSHMRPCPQAL